MWPIGYILGGPYSPLYVEQEMPTKNWRDAFEDLLALDSGGQMIDLDVRDQEALTAKRLWTQKIHRNVSLYNKQLKQDGKQLNLHTRIRDAYAKKGNAELAGAFDEQAKRIRLGTEFPVAHGQMQIAMLKDNENRILAASMYKSRPHWVTSLVSSGAITGWRANLFDSSEGLQVGFRKTEVDENEYHYDLQVTEMEMIRQFREGIPMRPGSPEWSTDNLHYPVSFSVRDDAPSTEDSINAGDNESPETKDIETFKPIFPAALRPMSILGQIITAERKTLRNGKITVNVLLTNHHTNGTIEKTEIRDNACKVSEELEKASDSMCDMREAWEDEARRQLYTTYENVAKLVEYDLD